MGWCSSVSLAFIVCYIKKMKVLFGLDFDQVILISKRHNSNKYHSFVACEKKSNNLVLYLSNCN